MMIVFDVVSADVCTVSFKFGFSFIVFVNGRSKEEIIPILKERMENEKMDEMRTATAAMVRFYKQQKQQQQLQQQQQTMFVFVLIFCFK